MPFPDGTVANVQVAEQFVFSEKPVSS